MSITELSRIRQEQGADGRTYWAVEILSAATGRWIAQSEHLTRAAAEADRRNWL